MSCNFAIHVLSVIRGSCARPPALLAPPRTQRAAAPRSQPAAAPTCGARTRTPRAAHTAWPARCALVNTDRAASERVRLTDAGALAPGTARHRIASSVVGVACVAVPVGPAPLFVLRRPYSSSLLGDSVGGVDGDSCCRAGEVDAGDAGRATARWRLGGQRQCMGEEHRTHRDNKGHVLRTIKYFNACRVEGIHFPSTHARAVYGHLGQRKCISKMFQLLGQCSP